MWGVRVCEGEGWESVGRRGCVWEKGTRGECVWWISGVQRELHVKM